MIFHKYIVCNNRLIDSVCAIRILEAVPSSSALQPSDTKNTPYIAGWFFVLIFLLISTNNQS